MYGKELEFTFIVSPAKALRNNALTKDGSDIPPLPFGDNDCYLLPRLTVGSRQRSKCPCPVAGTQEVLRIGLILFCFFPDIRGKINAQLSYKGNIEGSVISPAQ